MKVTPERAYAYRVLVSGLLKSLLEERISARTAINVWPTYANVDPSVQTAYTILWFYEADDDRRFRETYYSDVQLKLLNEVYQVLCDGEQLSPRIMTKYKQLQAPVAYEGKWFWQQPVWWMGRQIALMRTIVLTHPYFHRNKIS